MSDVWAPVVAAASALLLAPAGTLFVQWQKSRHDDREYREQQRLEVYSELIAAAGLMLTGFSALRIAIDMNSKWLHAWHQLTGANPKQPTQMDYLGFYMNPMERLMAAWSKAMVLFDQEEIDALNDLITASHDPNLMIPTDDPKSAEAKIGKARREFAAVARRKLGERAVRFEPQLAALEEQP